MTSVYDTTFKIRTSEYDVITTFKQRSADVHTTLRLTLEYDVITTFSRRSDNLKPTFKICTLEYDVSTTFKQRSDNVGYIKYCSDVS